MKRIKPFGILICLTLVFTVFQANAKASEWNSKTTVTINAPVEVPGFNHKVVIGPGTYVFKIMNSATNRNIVQIWNKDETHLITTILAISDFSYKVPDKPIIKFGENVRGAPVPVKEWFYPGDNYGWEFVYPRARAIKIAKANNENVLATNQASSEPRTLLKSKVTTVTPQGKEARVQTAGKTKLKH